MFKYLNQNIHSWNVNGKYTINWKLKWLIIFKNYSEIETSCDQNYITIYNISPDCYYLCQRVVCEWLTYRAGYKINHPFRCDVVLQSIPFFFTFFPPFHRVLFCLANSYNTCSCCEHVRPRVEFVQFPGGLGRPRNSDRKWHIALLSWRTMYYIDVRYTLLVFFIILFFSSQGIERHFFFERTDKRQTTFSLISMVFREGWKCNNGSHRYRFHEIRNRYVTHGVMKFSPYYIWRDYFFWFAPRLSFPEERFFVDLIGSVPSVYLKVQ